MAISLEQAQTLLDALGYPPGNKKGVFDEPTKKAIQRFQLDEHLLPTGVVDTLTEKTLVERAKEKGVDKAMPWYVWVGILVGVPLIAYGVYHLVVKKEERREKVLRWYDDLDLTIPRQAGAGARLSLPMPGPESGEPLPPALAYRVGLALQGAQQRVLEKERERAEREAYPATVRMEEIPATVVDPQIMAPGSRRPSVADRIRLDEEAQKNAYNTWASRMEVLGKSGDDFQSDYLQNVAALQARHKMDDPSASSEEIYNRAAAEIARADVKRASPEAQARFRRYVDIEKRKLLREDEARRAAIQRMASERNRRIQDAEIAEALEPETAVDTLRPRRVTMSEVLDVAGEAERRAKKLAPKKDPRYEEIYQNEMRRVIEERKGR